jgi:hypothetical protein
VPGVRVIFCDDPLTGRGPDADYAAEAAAVRRVSAAERPELSDDERRSPLGLRQVDRGETAR